MLTGRGGLVFCIGTMNPIPPADDLPNKKVGASPLLPPRRLHGPLGCPRPSGFFWGLQIARRSGGC